MSIPIVDFEDDDEARDEATLKMRYASDIGKLLKKGYNEVCKRRQCAHPIPGFEPPHSRGSGVTGLSANKRPFHT